MSKSTVYETALLSLVFNNTDFATVGDATGLRGSTAAGSLYVSLHTADPGEAGDQGTNETGYTGYARVGIPRNGTAWIVTGDSVSPANNVTFNECTASPGGAITYFGVGTASSGAGVLLYSGTVSPSITMATGVMPRLKPTTVISED